MSRSVAILICASLVAADAPPKPKPAPPELTRQERGILAGYAARAELVRIQAQRELDAIAAEQAEYLDGVARRLGLEPSKLGDYRIDLATGKVEPRPQARPQPQPEAPR